MRQELLGHPSGIVRVMTLPTLIDTGPFKSFAFQELPFCFRGLPREKELRPVFLSIFNQTDPVHIEVRGRRPFLLFTQGLFRG